MQLCILLVLLHVVACLGETERFLSRPRKGSVSLSALPAELLTALPDSLRHAYRSNYGIFPYYDTAVAAQSGGFIPEYDITDVNTSDLLNPPDSSFMYYSGNLMLESFAELRNKLGLHKIIKGIILEPSIISRISPNVWIGGAGVKASMHYDSVHNVYLHFAGVKTIRLLPPSTIHVSQMYGRLHPYACQSRINDTNTGERFRRAPYCITHDCSVSQPAGHEATDDRWNNRNNDEYMAYYNQHVVEHTLYPGDVLVIPPFWLHETQTHTSAISVSLWWDAAELDTMDQIFALPLPFEDTWSANYSIIAAQMFVTMLVETVESEVHVHLQHVHSGACVATNIDQHDGDVDVHYLTSQFSMDTLLRLLKIRYEDDWQHRNNSSFAYTHQPEPVHLNTTLVKHMQAAALARATVFTAGFLSEDNFIHSSTIQLNFTDKTHLNSTTGEGACINVDAQSGDCVEIAGHEPRLQQQATLESQLAVLSTKLCDYIEDVFHHVADVVVNAQSQSNDVHLVTRNAAAVDLLLDWVSLHQFY